MTVADRRAKAERTEAEARATIEAERKIREAKTARLRQARLAANRDQNSSNLERAR